MVIGPSAWTARSPTPRAPLLHEPAQDVDGQAGRVCARPEAVRQDGEAHLWFPRYELITHLVLKSEIRKAQIHFYQAFIDDHGYLCEPVPENEMFVQRAAPHDRRAGGAPTSIIADFVK